MITGKLKSQVDQLWLEFHSGGITNPLTVIEQISYLMFARMLDLNETKNEKRSSRLGKTLASDRIYSSNQQHLRWHNFRELSGPKMLEVVRDEVFPFFRKEIISKTAIGAYLSDAQLMIQKPSLLVEAVNQIHALPLLDRDTKGDLYEYLLSKLTTAGINGQFRTPRHIIRAMVEMLAPKPDERICDPACGTAGFLISTMEYLTEQFSTPSLIHTEQDSDGKEVRIFPGDKLEPYKSHIQKHLLTGFDFDVTMLRIAAMNLLLHGIDSPNIHYQDTLGNSFTEKWPTQASNGFDVILANPPFKGTIDEEDVHSTLKSKVKTKKTELLFLMLIQRMLKIGGRCAVIVPDGVLFGTSGAHIATRKALVEENQLEAMISLPGGVFKPYAGVSTGILIFTKGGKTNNVFFYDLKNDGYSLDDKRNPIPKNDLPDLLSKWNEFKKSPSKFKNKAASAFCVTATEIINKDYDLSLNKYQDVVHENTAHRLPRAILADLIKIEENIQTELVEIERMLK